MKRLFNSAKTLLFWNPALNKQIFVIMLVRFVMACICIYMCIYIVTQLCRICHAYFLKHTYNTLHTQPERQILLSDTRYKKISPAKFNGFMIFFSILLWKVETHIQNILQNMKLEIFSVAFCMCIQNWKQFDKQMWLISLFLLFRCSQ